VITELVKIEERKHVRQEQSEINKKKKEKAMAEQDLMDASMLASMTGGSPGRQWGGLGAMNQSIASSPAKVGFGGSPTKMRGFGAPS
jgi:hypothetical protein